MGTIQAEWGRYRLGRCYMLGWVIKHIGAAAKLGVQRDPIVAVL
jgi:hypothetical protein